MKKQLFLFFVSFSLALAGVKGFPCIGMEVSDDCCQPSSNTTLSNPYTSCCEGEEGKKGGPSLSSGVQTDSFVLVAEADVVVSSSFNPRIFSLPNIQNKSPPKTPIYLSHEALLL